VDVVHSGKLIWVQTTNYETDTLSTYGEKIEQSEAAINELLHTEENMFRMEESSEIRRGHNDALIYNYPGISFYSSGENITTETWLGEMGICNWREYIFAGDALDTLLGVRYRVISENQIETNENAFSLIWSADESETKSDQKGLDSGEELNRMLTAASGIQKSVLEQQWVEWQEDSDTTYTAELTIDEGGSYYVAIEKNADGEYPWAELFVNGVRQGFYSGDYSPAIQLMGEFDSGETIYLEVRFSSDVTKCTVYRENDEVLQEMKTEQLLQKGTLSKTEHTFEMKLQGSISNGDGNDIVLSIPYDAGWKIQVDGETAQTYSAFGVFLGIQAEEGMHQITARFLPRGLFAGIGISIASCVLLIVMLYCQKKRRENHLYS
jgi:uncharacterized membrane protein YfhO